MKNTDIISRAQRAQKVKDKYGKERFMTDTDPVANGTILVVDDEEFIVDLLRSILEVEGYQVHCGRSGREAVEIAMKVNPDLIIMDISMPDLDGYGATELIKQNPNLQAVPVIFLTGRSAEEDGGKAFATGATAFVRKPFKQRQIKDLVRLTMMSLSPLGVKKSRIPTDIS